MGGSASIVEGRSDGEGAPRAGGTRRWGGRGCGGCPRTGSSPRPLEGWDAEGHFVIGGCGWERAGAQREAFGGVNVNVLRSPIDIRMGWR